METIDFMDKLFNNRKTDYIVRATAFGEQARIIMADTRGLVMEAARLHSTSPLSSVALGRALTGVAMMAQMQKGDKGSVSLRFDGDGPIGGITVVSDLASNVRGFVHHPLIDLPLREDGNFDVGSAVGQGVMYVIKDLNMREPYVGQSEIISGEIGVDLTYYFANSEQTPSVVSVGVQTSPDAQILFAGGYIIQLMPDADESVINYIENTIDHIPSVTAMMASGETVESILDLLFGEKELEILETHACSYKCSCSREQMERGLISLGKKELASILKDIQADGGKPIECHCHFCNSDYLFDEKQITQLIDEISQK